MRQLFKAVSSLHSIATQIRVINSQKVLFQNNNKCSIMLRCRLCIHGGISDVTKEQSKNLRIVELKERGILRVGGSDASDLLQGLITNDIEILQPNNGKIKSIYSMFLNAQGRVLYDALIYHQETEDGAVYLIECDARIISTLQKHLKMYKLRRKVDIEDTRSEYKVWCLYDNQQVPVRTNNFWIPDPRLNTFMFRAITSSSVSVSEVSGEKVILASEDEYKTYRYKLGLAEGTDDIAIGKALPLETNLSFLNGVDFNKGCYIGQELTARTHHTGVIRKRFMPVKIISSSGTIAAGSGIKTEKGRNAGKFRSQLGNDGLALLRVAYSSCGEKLFVEHPDGTRSEMVAHIPPWWPEEMLQ